MPRWLQRLVARPELWCLTAFSAVLHFWRLTTPNAIVFDEAYFEKFAGEYLTGAYLFDVHPPLGRLMYAALAHLLDVPTAALLQGQSQPILRLLPAAFGTAIVPLVFMLLRQLRASRKVATLGAAAILLDNALLVDTRLVLTDVFLIGFGLGAMTLYLASRTREGRVRFAFIATSAFFAGCALSVKWTGASALGLILAAWFLEFVWTSGSIRNFVRTFTHGFARSFAPRFVREGLAFAVIPAAVYLGSFAIHFALLTHDGPGAGDMSTPFRRQLPGNDSFTPSAPKMSYWAKLADVHHAIKYANGDLQNKSNAGASPWYTWPIMKHPIGLWTGTTHSVERSSLVLLGNPVVWWGGMIAVLAGIGLFVIKRGTFAEHQYGFLVLLGGVAINYLPFIPIIRLMYLYHYLFALVFVVACAAYVVGVQQGWMTEDGGAWTFPNRRSATIYWSVMVLMLVAFIYFLPFTYGWQMSPVAYDQRMWVLRPRF